MASAKHVAIKDLSLDLKNFRTVPQPNELEAVKAMITISPDKFWGLMNSILDDGCLPTENIIAIKDSSSSTIVVKEGNRRVAVLKIAYDLIDGKLLNLPAAIQTKMKALSPQWKIDNKKVYCTVYDETESSMVDKIVRLAHGKGEMASRDQWSSIARARHNRDVNKVAEPGLDLLEKYLVQGMNLTGQQKERWAGDIQITVLDEAIKKLYLRLGATSVAELVNNYPTVNHREALEDILLAIGLKQLSFEMIRSTSNDFAVRYGVPALPPPPPPTPPVPPTGGTGTPNPGPTPSPAPGSTPTPSPSGGTGTPTPPTPPTPLPPPAPAPPINTPKSVINKLKSFSPIGNRDKVVTLRDEMVKLDLTKTPIAFCFLLRSMFEISAKAYCIDNGISHTHSNGSRDKTLVELLKAAANHMTGGQTTHPMNKVLHGALVQLTTPTSLLSVTSMNQLVHNTSFLISPSDICGMFNNIYPMLEAMN